MQLNRICQYNFRFFVETSSPTLNIIRGINAIFVFITNALLIIGVVTDRGRKSYTRNEKLMLFLSSINICSALLHIPLKIILIRSLYNISCWFIYLLVFLFVFLLSFSGSIILLISIERFISVIYNNEWRGKAINKFYLIFCLGFFLLVCFGLGAWFALVVNSANINTHVIFYCHIGIYTIILLVFVTVLNLSLLFKTRKKLRNVESVVVNRNLAIENRVTITIMLISVTLVLMCFPVFVSQFYLAFALYSKVISKVLRATALQNWTILLSELNTALNASIYLVRNRRVLRTYQNRFHLFINWFRTMVLHIV